VLHLVAVAPQSGGELLHSVQKGQHFLPVVGRVRQFFPRLKKGVDDVVAHLPKPGVLGIQLVAQDQAKDHASGFFLDSLRQRSEQNFT
jgi:hypothetical protein